MKKSLQPSRPGLDVAFSAMKSKIHLNTNFRLIIFTLLLLFGIVQCSSAQVYYTTSDGTGTSTSSNDALYRMNYDGSSNTTLASSFTNSPLLVALDLANNRAFVYEGFSSSVPTNLAIKVVNLSTGAVTLTIPLPARIAGLRYDPATDYIYYLETDGVGSTLSASDAIVKVKSDGTGSTVVVADVTAAPILFALDLPNNRAFVYEGFVSDRQIKVINLSTGALINSIALSALTNGIEYDPSSNYIYYLTSDANPNTATANDALIRVHPDGTGSAVVASSLTTSPLLLALDAGNNRAFVYEALVASRSIKSVNLTTGAVAQVISLSGLPSSPLTTVTGLVVPSSPVVTTAAVTTITSSSATVGGNVTQSDASVTDRGIVYSTTNALPTISDSKFAIGSGTGSFSSSLSSLSSNTTYHQRAYATSTAGTAYGAEADFITLTAAVPVISNTGSIAALAGKQGEASPSSSFSVSGANMLAGILVTPSAGFEVSTDNTNFFSTVTVGAAGTIAPTTVYIRFAATAGLGFSTGTVKLTSSGATEVDVPIPLSVVFPPATITAIRRADSNPTNSTTVHFRVSDNNGLFTISSANLSLTGSVTGSISSVSPTDILDTAFVVTVTGVSGNGPLGLNVINDNGLNAHIANTLPVVGPSYTIDNTAPASVGLIYKSNNANGQLVAKVGDVISLDFTANEAINSPSITIAGHAASVSLVTGNEWLGTYTMTSGDTEGRIPFSVSITDLAGNAGPTYNDVAAGDDIEFDKTLPTVSFSSPTLATTSVGPVSYTVTYADANFNTSTLALGNITLHKTGTANGTVGLSGSGTSYTVSITGITGLGNLSLSIAAGTASDNAGNLAAASATSPTVGIVTPTFTETGSLTALSTMQGTPSVVSSFSVAGTNMSAGILVTPPAGFEVSADNVNFSSAVTIGGTNTIPSSLVYIRLTAADGVGTYSGNVVLTSLNATTKNVPTVLSTVHPLIPTPTIQARLVTFTNTTSNSTTISWTNGNGVGRVVFMRLITSGYALPANGTLYTASTTFGSGTQIGTTGWFCVYNGTGSSVDVSGLTQGSTYRVTVLEYSGTPAVAAYLENNLPPGNPNYLQSRLSPANVTTVATYPTVPARLVTYTGTTSTSTTVSWTSGNGTARVAFMELTGTGSVVLTDHTTYAPNTVFGSGSQVVMGIKPFYCIYNGTGNSVTVTGLTPGTLYRVTVVEYKNGAGSEMYLNTGQSPANVTTGPPGSNSLYVPNGNGQLTPLVSSFGGQKLEANNILSPNGDGINDIWVVKNIAFYPNNMVTVYDREGKVVFTKKNYSNDWSGAYRGGILNQGTYYYAIDLGNGTVTRGFITVVR